MNKTRMGGGVMVAHGDFFPEEKRLGYPSKVGILETELADYLNLTATEECQPKDFYNMFKNPQRTPTEVLFEGVLTSFRNICRSLTKSKLRHVGELLTQVIKHRVADMQKNEGGDRDKDVKHINTLAGFVVARKDASWVFREKNGEVIRNPLNLDFNALAGIESTLREPINLFTFLTTKGKDKNQAVTTYDEFKVNLELLGTDFKRRIGRVKTRKERTFHGELNSEKTSSYSDNALDDIHVYERGHVIPNLTKRQINQEQRDRISEAETATAAFRKSRRSRSRDRISEATAAFRKRRSRSTGRSR